MFDEFLADAISKGETEYEYGSCRDAQQLLIEFNETIDTVVDEFGLQKSGDAIWYLYGCVSNTTHDALDDSVASGYEPFYKSLQSLYENGFAKHCRDGHGHSDSGCMFAMACYMLWDMDSGLEYWSFHGSVERFELVSKLIDFGLGHSHAAIQESILHCLGHRHLDMPEFVNSKIGHFLKRQDLQPEIRGYAECCREGLVL